MSRSASMKEIQARQRSNFPLTLMEMEMETSIQESVFLTIC